MTWRIKNWAAFQHYKHRNPPWVRLYRKLLDDPQWFALSGDASKMLANCWLLASEKNGELPTVATIAFRLRMTEVRVKELISQLDHWLIGDASTMLAERKQVATTETDNTETDNTETDSTEVRASARNRAKIPLPPDFIPITEVAERLGWPRSKIMVELSRFADSARAHNRKYANWQAAWDNWCRSPYQQQQGAVNGQSKRAGSILDAIDNLSFEGGVDQTAGQNVVQRLPPR